MDFPNSAENALFHRSISLWGSDGRVSDGGLGFGVGLRVSKSIWWLMGFSKLT